MRFLHGFVGKEASKEDVEAQIPQASEGKQTQAQEVIERPGLEARSSRFQRPQLKGERIRTVSGPYYLRFAMSGFGVVAEEVFDLLDEVVVSFDVGVGFFL